MLRYRPPLRDMRFVLHEVLGAERELTALPGFEEVSAEVIDHVLAEAGRLCEEAIFPTNTVGDEQGCRFEAGEVRTPAGFKEAYRAFAEGGWVGLACEREHGGQGLPHTLGFFVSEMLASANLAFSLYPVLTQGAIVLLAEHAPDWMKRAYLPPLASGTWSAGMCLTEAHCGTDIGLTRTRATPQPDGTYAVTGSKIFITGGEHDLTDNIVYLMLARTPDAPAGVKGISLFLVPKFLVGEDGSLGARNGVACTRIERKMGIKGASTCELRFEGALGHLVGEANRGLHAMFTMMNHERLAVGLQGLAQAEVAYQSAAAYAKERRQGRALGGARCPEAPADPIIVHPDVRRMLLTARACNEAARAVAGWVALAIDRARHAPDAADREAAEDRVALLTPVVKAFFTDYGSEACNLCLQVFGGHGYIRESGMEQLVRDVRIAQIYEGTNGIQALDLVKRKLPLGEGRAIAAHCAVIEQFLARHREHNALADIVAPLEDALARLRSATEWIRRRSREDPEELGAAASDYLRLMGLVTFSYMWARMAAVALARSGDDTTGFYRSKMALARFFMKRLLPEVHALSRTIEAGSESLLELAPEDF